MLKKLISFFPTKMPIGVDEFNAWAADVIMLSNTPDNSSTRFSLCVMIMHRPATEWCKSKRFYAKQLYKAAVNEVAHSMAQGYKEAQRLSAVSDINDQTKIIEAVKSQVV